MSNSYDDSWSEKFTSDHAPDTKRKASYAAYNLMSRKEKIQDIFKRNAQLSSIRELSKSLRKQCKISTDQAAAELASMYTKLSNDKVGFSSVLDWM